MEEGITTSLDTETAAVLPKTETEALPKAEPATEEEGNTGELPSGEKKGSVKRVSNVRLYFATLRFALGRSKYFLLAMVLMLLYYIVSLIVKSFFPDVADKLSWLINIINTILIFKVFSLVEGWNKRLRFLGQVGIISHAVMYGEIPKRPFRTGINMARARFKDQTVGKLLKDTLRFLFKRVFKRNRKKEEIVTHLLILVQEVVAFLLLMFAGSVAKLGACVIAYCYRFPNSSVNIRTALKAGRRYFKHIWGVLGQFLINLAILLPLVVFFIAPLSLYLLLYLTRFQAFMALRDYFANERFNGDMTSTGVVLMLIIGIVIFLILWVFVLDPFATIRMVRFYLKHLDNDGKNMDEDMEESFVKARKYLYESVHKRIFRKRYQRGLPEGTQKGLTEEPQAKPQNGVQEEHPKELSGEKQEELQEKSPANAQ